MGEAVEQRHHGVAWAPHPGPQEAFVNCPVEDVFFGGARGPGKTDGLLGDWLLHGGMWHRHARGLLVRRTMPQLQEIIERTHELFPKVGALYNVNDKVWRHPSGWRLRLSHLWDGRDAANYQGHQYTWIGYDEGTNWPSMEPIDKLRACLRSPAKVPCVLRGTGNPGGPGHNVIKARYIDPAPPMTPFRACVRCDAAVVDGERTCKHTDSGIVERVYIPGTLDDNPALAHDSGYWQRVEAAAAGDEGILRAWRYGEWEIVAGGMFDGVWRTAKPVIEPFPIPAQWFVNRSFDWGSSKPFCVLWFAEANGEDVHLPDGTRISFPKGTLFVIAEDYGWTGKPNQGLDLPPAAIAKRVLDAEQRLGLRGRVRPGPGDTPQSTLGDGRSVATEMASAGVRWTAPTKGPGSRQNGWALIRQRLAANTRKPMEEPGLFVFSTCRNLIRTLPALPRDDRKPDDADTDAEDHAADALRYRCTEKRNEVTEAPGWL